MCDALKELFAEELKEENEKGMERGIHLAKIIFKLSAQGSSDEEIAKKCDLPLKQVREVLEKTPKKKGGSCCYMIQQFPLLIFSHQEIS